MRDAFSANPQAALSDAPSEAAKALVAKDLARPGGWRFYNPVLVTRDGQEMWHRDNEIIFPREMVAEFGGDVDVATLMLWNLEQRGGIAPGQLRD